MPTYNQPLKSPFVLRYNENGKNKEWSHRPKAQAGGAHVLPLLNPRLTYTTREVFRDGYNRLLVCCSYVVDCGTHPAEGGARLCMVARLDLFYVGTSS